MTRTPTDCGRTITLGLGILLALTFVLPGPGQAASNSLSSFLRTNLPPDRADTQPYQIGLLVGESGVREDIRNSNLDARKYRFYSFLRTNDIARDPDALKELARQRDLDYFLIWQSADSNLILYDPHRKVILDEMLHQRSRSESPPRPGPATRTNQPYRSPRMLSSVLKISGLVRDFDFARRSSVELFGWIEKRAFSIGRWEQGQVESTHTHPLPLGAVNLNFVSLDKANPRTVHLLITFGPRRKKQIWTTLYEYDLVDRTLEPLWTANDILMNTYHDSVYAQSFLKHRQHFEQILPVNLTREGWSYRDNRSDQPGQSLIYSFAPLPAPGQFVRLNSDGHLVWYTGDGKTIYDEYELGRSPIHIPVVLSQQQSEVQMEKKVFRERNQGVMVLPRDEGSSSSEVDGHRVYVIRNFVSQTQRSKGFMQSLMSGVSYDRSQLLELSLRDGQISTRSRSRVLEGYLSQIRWFDGRIWALKIQPGVNNSELYVRRP